MLDISKDSKLAWHVAHIDYKHKCSNVLRPRKTRGGFSFLFDENGPAPDSAAARSVAADPSAVLRDIFARDDEELTEADRNVGELLVDMELPPCDARARPVPVPPKPLLPALPAGLVVEGADVKVNGKRIGIMSYLVAWDPPSYSMKCLHRDHGACSLTSDWTQAGIDALTSWVAAQDLFSTGPEHRAAAPSNCRARIRGRTA